jgi:two-component system, NarL family, sensor histidine kinase DevS
VIAQEERLRGLVDMGILLTSQLSLETVLDKLLEAAMNLTGAGYAALGVVHRSGRGLERFLHRGLDDETVRQIGDPPVGRGILGALIEGAQPLRLHDLSEDPRSVGFPPGHPEMRTFLGVPVLLRGVVYGNLYLTEKQRGEDFTEEDMEVATVLAAQAAVAIENARLYESQTRWMRQLESMEEIGFALVSDLELPRMLELICRRLRELVGARTVFVALPTADGNLRVEAAADDQNGAGAIGTSVPVPESMTGRAYAGRRTFRVDSFIDDPEIDQALARRLAELMRLPPPTAGVFAPLLVRERSIGAIVAHDKVGEPSGDLRFSEEDARLVEAIAARAAVAVDLSRRVERDGLRRVVAAQEQERQRLARELHDETGQALTSMLLGLRAAEEAEDEQTRRRTLASLRELAAATLQDVRRLALELRPKALDDFGLVAALERLVEGFRERTGLEAQFEARLDERLPHDTETALYRIVQEALTNVIKHARATTVSILITRKPASVTAVVEDDGVGFTAEDRADGLGLVSMRERAALVGGRLTVESSKGAGTTLVAEVPAP